MRRTIPMKTAVLISGLLLLLVANLVMIYVAPYGLSAAEGFQNGATPKEPVRSTGVPMVAGGAPGPMPPPAGAPMPTTMPEPQPAPPMMSAEPKKEGFASYFLENAGGAKELYEPIGAYDGVVLKTGNSVSAWRYTAPNEPLQGPEFKPGPDSLFLFKNNQCKPECCGSSFSCGGGCVCTTPQQRQYIAGRAGTRTQPEDSA